MSIEIVIAALLSLSACTNIILLRDRKVLMRKNRAIYNRLAAELQKAATLSPSSLRQAAESLYRHVNDSDCMPMMDATFLLQTSVNIEAAARVMEGSSI